MAATGPWAAWARRCINRLFTVAASNRARQDVQREQTSHGAQDKPRSTQHVVPSLVIRPIDVEDNVHQIIRYADHAHSDGSLQSDGGVMTHRVKRGTRRTDSHTRQEFSRRGIQFLHRRNCKFSFALRIGEMFERRQQFPIGKRPVHSHDSLLAGLAKRFDGLRDQMPELLLPKRLGKRPAVFVLVENEDLVRARALRPGCLQRPKPPIAGPTGFRFRARGIKLVDTHDHDEMRIGNSLSMCGQAASNVAPGRATTFTNEPTVIEPFANSTADDSLGICTTIDVPA